MAEGIGLDTILHIAEIVSLIGGGGVTLFKLGGIAQNVETAIAAQVKEITELKVTVSAIGRLMTDVALQNQRLDTHDKRIDNLDRHFDELRHGEGLIAPR